jgi:hypothetical protein
MRRYPTVFITIVSIAACTRAAPEPATFVGRQACVECHQAESEAWEGSHHALAMQPADSKSVAADFNDTRFTSTTGVTTTAFRRDGEYWVRTDGPDGRLAEYPIAFTFGVTPLQEYLIAFPGGRYQALNVLWDTGPRAEGGQRWFHLYPGEKVDHRDILHWTGPLQNWNFMCAECHSTDLRKNYQADSGTYTTTWSEISVSCEACHGPGSRHAEERRAKRKPTANSGFDVALSKAPAGTWRFADGEPIARRASPLRAAPRWRPAPAATRAGRLNGATIATARHSPRPTGWHCSRRACITPMGRSSTRSTSTARSARVGCTPRALRAPIVTSRTAGDFARQATRSAPRATCRHAMTRPATPSIRPAGASCAGCQGKIYMGVDGKKSTVQGAAGSLRAARHAERVHGLPHGPIRELGGRMGGEVVRCGPAERVALCGRHRRRAAACPWVRGRPDARGLRYHGADHRAGHGGEPVAVEPGAAHARGDRTGRPRSRRAGAAPRRRPCRASIRPAATGSADCCWTIHSARCGSRR